MGVKEFGVLLKEAFSQWQADKAARLAAALSYYTIFSLAPLLVILIAVAGLAYGQQAAQNQVVGQIEGLVGAQSAQVIQSMLAAAQDQSAGILATIVGVVTLLFGATGLFSQLQEALNTVWNVEPDPDRGVWGVIKARFLSFLMVLVIGFLLIVSLLLSTLISAVSQFFGDLLPASELVFQVVNILVSLGVITLLFALLFKYLPDAEIAWKDVWPGALLTAVLFTLGKELIGLYLGRAAVGDAYGAAGSLVVLLLWIYYSAQILFYGAEFTQVYASRYGSAPQVTAALRSTAPGQPEGARPVAGQLGAVPPGVAQPAAGVTTDRAPGSREPAFMPSSRRRPELLPQAQPSLLALSAVLSILVGFLSGMVVKRGGKR